MQTFVSTDPPAAAAAAPEAAPPARHAEWADRAVEAAYGFLIVTPMLFVVQLGSAAPALSYAFICLYALRHGRQALESLLRRWPLLVFLGLAVASTVWSDYRSLTLKHSFELCGTAIGGLLLSSSRRPMAALSGVWGAFALFMVLSLGFGHSIGVGQGAGGDDSAFAGLNGAKNLFGLTAALGVLLSLFQMTYALRSRSWAGVAASVCILALELYLTWVARSAGALVSLVLATAAFFVTDAFRFISPRLRGVAWGFLTAVLAGAGALAYAYANNVTSTVLDIFHKDPTLTGREYLWYRAHDIIQDRPLLGRGFEAFWVQGNTDAEGLWEYGKIAQRGGFNFHNTLIELLVHFGWVGTVLTLLVFATAFGFLVRRCIREPSLAVAFYFAFMVFELARSPFESLMPAAFDFTTLLLFASLGFGFHALPAPARAFVLQPASGLPYRTPASAQPGVWSLRSRMARDSERSL